MRLLGGDPLADSHQTRRPRPNCPTPCLQLASLARSGALTAVYVPKAADEAIRALPRARADTLSVPQDATRRLKACMLRPDLRAVHAHTEHLQRLEQALHDHVKDWRCTPVGQALYALGGL